MEKYINIPLYCEKCRHCLRQGDIMVGTDKTGGGPEDSYSCTKNRNMTHYWFHNTNCPDFEDYY